MIDIIPLICPICGNKNKIIIEYVDCSTTKTRVFVKGHYNCENNCKHICDKIKETYDNAPIYK